MRWENWDVVGLGWEEDGEYVLSLRCVGNFYGDIGSCRNLEFNREVYVGNIYFRVIVYRWCLKLRDSMGILSKWE